MSIVESAFMQKKRQHWMGVLAKTKTEALENAWDGLSGLPNYTFLRKPETGNVMVRARAGGSGQQFNLGEVSVTRCSVSIENGHVGMAYVMGCNHRHAELAAVFDGLLQDSHYSSQLKSFISTLEANSKAQKKEVVNQTETTKVEFFTMVRGE